MRKHLIGVALLGALAMLASAQLNPQQQKMTEYNAQAKGMTGDARKTFMSTCLPKPRSRTASTASRAAIPASRWTGFATSEAAAGWENPDAAGPFRLGRSAEVSPNLNVE
jgi:hypothetical protein